VKVSTFVKRTIQGYVDRHRVVVWYDAEGVFASLAAELELRDCVVVSASESRLEARRRADEVFLELCSKAGGAPGLLIYAPQVRGVQETERVADMFECFAVAGTAFGDQESEQVQSLARQAMPEAADEIDRLFREGRPTLRMLDGLEKSGGYPLVKQALGTQTPADVGALLLADGSAAERIESVDGARGDLERLLQSEFGFESAGELEVSALVRSFARFALLSELSASLGGEMPDGLDQSLPVSGDRLEAVTEACVRARRQADLRESYVQTADQVEKDLQLALLLSREACTWRVDTFRCQNDLALRAAATRLENGDADGARRIAETRRGSVWVTETERSLLWRVLDRCIEFSAAMTESGSRLLGKVASTEDWLNAYCCDSGLWRIDRLQRLLEQSYAECVATGALDAAVEVARSSYRTLMEKVQGCFLPAVERDGWPPDGCVRASQSYERTIAPMVTDRHRVVYFLVDALRYEMARDLAEGLKPLGEIELEPIAAALPTTTAVGMAALMPCADGALRLEEANAAVVPAVGSQLLPGSAERMSYLKSLLGDRFEDVTLGELLSLTEKKATARFGEREILVVRTQDIDELGEGTNLLLARQMMSTILSHLRKATDLLAGLGFTRFVYVADHGHILLPEIPPGDVVSAPSGDWVLTKRRCRLGVAHTSAAGTLALRPADLGIVTSARDFVVPTGMRVFAAGGGYFHEGISLQECIVPLLVLKAGAKDRATGQADVHLSYKSGRFTARVIGLKLMYMNLLEPEIDVRVEAYDGPGAKATLVGHAADCEARDEATGLIRLKNGEETQVPVLINGEFGGDVVELRAVDPISGRVLDKLTLKNDTLD